MSSTTQSIIILLFKGVSSHLSFCFETRMLYQINFLIASDAYITHIKMHLLLVPYVSISSIKLKNTQSSVHVLNGLMFQMSYYSMKVKNIA